MLGGVFSALEAFAEAFKDVFQWKTGGRSSDDNALRSEAEKWRGEYDKAMAGKDFAHANFALSQLRKLRDEALAKSRT
jgi:hypothetical protein